MAISGLLTGQQYDQTYSGQVAAEINNKVDKVTGKQLSTEDYTTTEKNKLASLSGTTSIADDSITNAKLANVATATIKGRVTAGTGDPEDLTVAQAKALLKILAADISNFQAQVSANTDVAAMKAIIGSGVSDGDSIVDTLAEMLTVFQTYSEGVDLATQLALKAPLASPALTNTPTAPTAAAGTNTTQIATTAHVFAERTNAATLTNKIESYTAALGANNTYNGKQITGLNAGATIAQWEA